MARRFLGSLGRKKKRHLRDTFEGKLAMARRLSQVNSRGVARRRRRKFPCGDSNGESGASGGGGSSSPSSRDLPSNKKARSLSLVCSDVRSMHGPAASGDFVRPVTQMVDGESSRPTTDFFLTHSPRRLSYIRDFLLRSKELPSLVGADEARSTRGTPQGEKICVK